MNTENNILAEWRPTEGFNLLDFRDFYSFPQYGIPPYVLRFRFANTQEPLGFVALAVHFMGWNVPECGTSTLFSKVQISKNGFQDVYSSQPGGKMGKNFMVFRFVKKLVLRENDVLVITLFPLCPAHMVDVDTILFLTDELGRSTPPPSLKTDSKSDSDNNGKPEDVLQLLKNPVADPYWYIYATVFAMVLLLLISMLFATINQPKKYIVVRPPRRIS